MEVIKTRAELRQWIGERKLRKRVLVPTMGALHRGHTSLFDRALTEAGTDGEVLATIFVNPTQFGPNEDFDAYPRQLEDDLTQCQDHGVAAVFTPEQDEVYEADASISIRESSLSAHLCGASRPGHFDGVCLVVAKLFLMTQPTAAVFGEKDFQQLAIIRRLVRDLDFPIEIIGAETVREPDGLALSSRNAYLSEEERQQAPIIHQALTSTAARISAGEILTPEAALTEMRNLIDTAPNALIDYVAAVDASTLQNLDEFDKATVRLLAAVRFGKTRLIDNVGVNRAD